MAKIRLTGQTTVLHVISFGTYIFDIVSDILLAISFHVNGDEWYFSLTLAFIVLSAIISNLMSLLLSGMTLLEEEKSKTAYIFPIIIHCCLLGVPYSYAMTIFCGISDNHEYRAGITALGLFEILLEAGPQLILQLYIIIASNQVIRPEFQTDDYVGIAKRNTTALVAEGDFFQKLTSTTMIFQTISIVTSLLAIAWVLTKWSKMANERSWVADVCYFIWHVFSVGALIFAIALFASVFTFWTPVVILCRFIIFGIYMIRSSSHSLSLILVLRKMLYGLIYTFSYFGDASREPSRKEYFMYFVYESIENSILVGLWSWVIDSEVNTFLCFVLIIEFSSVGICFIFMGIYLFYFHVASKFDPEIRSAIAECEVEMQMR